MPELKASEIRKMNEDEREKKIEETRLEISKQKALIASGGALEDPGNMKLLKRRLARLLTIEREIQKQIDEKNR